MHKSGTQPNGYTKHRCSVKNRENWHKKYDNDPAFRELMREKWRQRRADPDYRRRQSIYMIWYVHKKKRERYGDEGLTLGNHGKEDRQGRDRTVA